MKKHISLIISILCISAMANAANYFVDLSSGNDANNGSAWSTYNGTAWINSAKKTIDAASTLAVSGENIYIKGGTFTTTAAMVFKAGVNYYGSYDAAITGTATTRSLSDMDGNGVIEPWEFSNPTLLSSTNASTSGTAGVFNFASLCSIDGFVFTSTYSGGTYVRVFTQDAAPNNTYTFRNNIIRNCNISNSTGGSSSGFLTLTGTSTNCLIENNRFNVTTNTSFNNNTNRGLVVVGSGANVSNFVIRNNNLNYNLSTVAADMTSNSTTMGFIVQLSGGGATVVKNLIINNNEIYFTGSTSPNLPIATRGAILSFGSTTATDYILNCTVANNKTTNLSCAGISFNSALIQAYNNVAFNNYNTVSSTSTTSLSNMVIPVAITSAGLVSKNVTNGAGIANATYATNNDNTQTAIDNSSFKFSNPTNYNGLPTSYSGNPVGKAAATSLWSIAHDSYLVAKGITNSNIVNDKNGNAFAATPAVGAYEGQSNYFVDFSKANDTGAGTSWETAKKTISAASALGKAYDNIYIKGGTFSTNALVAFAANRNYYGSFDSSNTGTTTTRAVSDLDLNGIVEPWEFSNPTLISSTYYNTTAAITVAASIVDGFVFTHTINSSAPSSPRFLIFSNAPIFRNNSIQNCNITYANGTLFSGATFSVLMNPLGTFSNNLVQNNNLTFNATSGYIGGSAYPFMPLSGVTASGCIVRNNKMTLNCASATSVSNNLYPFVTISKHTLFKTVLKNSIIHNNEVVYTGPGSTGTLPNCGALTLYEGGVTDSILNCTVANNKMTNAATTAGINFNFHLSTNGIQAYNNVAWNNYNGSTLANYNSVAESGMIAGTLIKNNFSNGAGLTNGTKITGSDNSQTATDNTQFLFSTPTTAAGNTTDLTSEKSVWSIGSGSYLVAKGVTASNLTDKAGALFDTPRSVGAYESTSKTAQVISFSALSSKIYGDANFSLSATGGTSGNAVTFTSSDATVATCTGTNGATVTIIKAGNCKIYANQIGNASYSAAVQVEQILTINPKALTMSGLSVPASKLYDGTTTAVVSGTPALGTSEAKGSGTTSDGLPYTGDVVSITGTAVGTYNLKDVASATTVTYSALALNNGNYSLTIQGTSAATITAKALTMSGLSVPASKVYDGLTSAVVTDGKTLQTAEAAGAGTTSDGKPYTGDVVSITGTAVGTYNTKDVGATTVTYSGLALNNANYSLTIQETSAATITAKALTMSGLSVPASKVYDGLTSAVVTDGKTLQAAEAAGAGTTSDGKPYTGDVVSITGTAVGTYNSKDVVSATTVTFSALALNNGNYSLTIQGTSAATIIAKALSIGSASIASKVYDGNPTSGTVTSGTLSGLVSPETLTISSAVGTYADANIGTGKGATIVYTLADGTNGGLAANYSLANGSANGDITAATITLSSDIVVNATSYTAPQLENSDLVVSSGEFVLNQSTATIKSVTVAPGAKLTLGSNTLTATNGITLQSDASGTATLLDSYSTPTINATVKQHVTAGRNWYMSSPVSAADYSLLNRGTAVQEWNEVYKRWDEVTTGNLVKGKGYIQVATSNGGVTGSTGTVNFNGTTNSGDVSVTLSRTESGSSIGFNLVGNPYPSYLDWKNVAAANTNVLPTAWFRTKNNSGGYIFATVNVANPLSPVIVAVDPTTTITTYIPPMQAYWVRLNENPLTTVYKVTNLMRDHFDNATNKFKAPKQNTQQILRLQLSNGTNSDEAVVYFNQNASNGFDLFDSPKMANGSNSIPEIYTLEGTEKLVINGLNSIQYDTELPIGFTTGQSTTFSLKASEISNFEVGTQIVLKDYLDINNPVITDITDGSYYSFASDITKDNTNRFRIIFKTSASGTDVNNSIDNGNLISIFKNVNNHIEVNIPIDIVGKSSVSVYNAVGQKLEIKSLNSTVNVLSNSYLSGVYIVSINVNGKSVNRKVIIN